MRRRVGRRYKNEADSGDHRSLRNAPPETTPLLQPLDQFVMDAIEAAVAEDDDHITLHAAGHSAGVAPLFPTGSAPSQPDSKRVAALKNAD